MYNPPFIEPYVERAMHDAVIMFTAAYGNSPTRLRVYNVKTQQTPMKFCGIDVEFVTAVGVLKHAPYIDAIDDINGRAYSVSIFTPNNTTPVLETECAHQWTSYTGLMQSFDYCTKCDIKRS